MHANKNLGISNLDTFFVEKCIIYKIMVNRCNILKVNISYFNSNNCFAISWSNWEFNGYKKCPRNVCEPGSQSFWNF